MEEYCILCTKHSGNETTLRAAQAPLHPSFSQEALKGRAIKVKGPLSSRIFVTWRDWTGWANEKWVEILKLQESTAEELCAKFKRMNLQVVYMRRALNAYPSILAPLARSTLERCRNQGQSHHWRCEVPRGSSPMLSRPGRALGGARLHWPSGVVNQFTEDNIHLNMG